MIRHRKDIGGGAYAGHRMGNEGTGAQDRTQVRYRGFDILWGIDRPLRIQLLVRDRLCRRSRHLRRLHL